MKTGVTVTFGFYDVTAKEDAAFTAEELQSFSDLAALQEKDELVVGKYGTLERNFFGLDGSFDMLSQREDVPLGVWYEMLSDEAGQFLTIPVLTVDFDQPHSSSGVTLRFYEPTNDYCSRLRMTWYDGGGNQLQQQEYRPEQWRYFCEGKVLDYQKIVIEFLATNRPYRFLKLTGIDFGEKIIWDEHHLVQASMREITDPAMGQISMNALNLVLHSDDPRFSLYYPQGVYELLQERQELEVKRYLAGDLLDRSLYYLSDWEEAGENPARLEAYDQTVFLDSVNFLGDMYLGEGILAGELIDQIMAKAKVNYELAEELATVKVWGWLPYGTCREALRQVCYVIGGLVDGSRGDVLRIIPYPISEQGNFALDRQEMGASLRQGQLVTAVELQAHTYKESPGDQETLYEEELSIGEHEITFHEPKCDIKVSGSGVQVLELSANGAVLNVTTEGMVKVTGFSYQDQVKTVRHGLDIIPAGNKANIIVPEDCTLVNETNRCV